MAADDAASAPTMPATQNVVLFNDDDDAQPIKAESKLINAPATGREESESEDEDEDDAPEVVSTSHAAAQQKKSTQAAQKAAREQVASQKRKRQERDTALKQQTEERRKVGAQIKALQKSEAEAAAGQLVSQSDSQDQRRRKPIIPDVLPAEFLTDSSSDEEDDDEHGVSTAAHSRPKKRKVSSIEKKLTRRDNAAPRDQIVGNTTYRIAKKVDGRLPPRMKKQSRGIKDRLLKRNRQALSSSSGFFRR